MDYYPDRLLVRSGRRSFYDGSGLDYPEEALKHTYSRHMTMMFNVLFMLVLGKLFHARELRDRFNLLSGIR